MGYPASYEDESADGNGPKDEADEAGEDGFGAVDNVHGVLAEVGVKDIEAHEESAEACGGSADAAEETAESHVANVEAAARVGVGTTCHVGGHRSLGRFSEAAAMQTRHYYEKSQERWEGDANREARELKTGARRLLEGILDCGPIPAANKMAVQLTRSVAACFQEKKPTSHSMMMGLGTS